MERKKSIAAHVSGTMNGKEYAAMVKAITEQNLDAWMIHVRSGEHRG